MIKFIDANVFIERWNNPRAKEFIDKLDKSDYGTSVLVLSEVHHKLEKKKIKNIFEYIRTIMGAITIFEVTPTDFFDAMKNPLQININDKIHLAVIKRNNIQTIISYDKDFDKDKTISREEP